MNGAAPDRPPPCLKCVHYKVSWDPAFPHACTLFGLRSRDLPSRQVFLANGRHCPSFVLSSRIRES